MLFLKGMVFNLLEGSYQLGLSDLMDQNLSCYEFVMGLPKHMRTNLERQDFGSFEDIRRYVADVYGYKYEGNGEV